MAIVSTMVCARIPYKKWSSPHSQQKNLRCSTWVQSQKRQNSLCVQGKPFSITVIWVYALTTDAEVDWFCEDLQDLLELTPKKGCPFHHRGLECKSRKSRGTWNNRQVWPLRTKWIRADANRVLPREHTGHNKHSLPTTQEMTLHMDITRLSILK